MGAAMENIQFRIEPRMAADKVGEIMVYGHITGYPWYDDDVSASMFDKALKSLGDIDRLNVRINSGGGSVFQAVAMRTMLLNHKAEKHFYIEGICASAATLLLTINGTVHAAQGSYTMIHRPMMGAWGNAADVKKTFDLLLKYEADFRDFYCNHSGQSAEQIQAWMEEEKWMDAQEAVEAGFADDIIEGADAVASVEQDMYMRMKAMYRNVPELPTAQVEALVAPEDDKNGHPEVPNQVSNAAPAATENMEVGSEQNQMDMKDLTIEMLTQERPDLVNLIEAQGVTREQQRIEAIDKATVKGYEPMAFEAKHGKAKKYAGDYALAVLAEQQKKGADFIENRAKETASAAEVPGGEAAGSDGEASDANETLAAAKELAQAAARK